MIVKVAPCLAPYSFDLEVGELVRNLAHALTRLGNEVCVFVPYSKDLAKLDMRKEIALLRVEMDDEIVEELWLKSFEFGEGIKIYVVGDDKFFTDKAWEGDGLLRADVFCHASLAALEKLGIKPKAVNCYGWQSSSLPCLIKKNKYFKNTACVYTVSQDLSSVLEDKEKLSALKKGIALSDKIIVSSGKYAGEIYDSHDEDVLARLISIRKDVPIGILSGVDYKANDPLKDKLIEHNYDEALIKERSKNKTVLQKISKLAQENVMIISILGPLNQINGGQILIDALPGLIELGFQLIVAGELEINLEKSFSKLAKDNPGKIIIRQELDYEYLHQLLAGSDLMLSLSPFASGSSYYLLLALRYGCIPLIFSSGSAIEIVENYDPNRETGNGFVFEQYSKWGLFAAAIRAHELARFPYDWAGLQENGMQARFFWHETAKQYIDAYRDVITAKQPGKKILKASLPNSLPNKEDDIDNEDD